MVNDDRSKENAGLNGLLSLAVLKYGINQGLE